MKLKLSCLCCPASLAETANWAEARKIQFWSEPSALNFKDLSMIEMGHKIELPYHENKLILSLNNRAKPHLFLLNLEGRHENYLMKTDDFLTVRKCFHCALSEFVCQI